MKLGYKLMLFGLVAMVAMPFFVVKPDGTRMMSPMDWLPSKADISDLANSVSHKAGSDVEFSAPDTAAGDSLRGTGKMYSWRDAKGRMHFSENPPEDVSQAAVNSLPQDVNLIQSVDVPQSGSDLGNSQSGESDGGFKLAFPTTIPVQDIPKLVDDAKHLQTLADQRNAAATAL